MLNKSTVKEIIGVKLLSGQWSIIPMNFSQDTGNHFRTIYPAFIYVGEYILKFLKPSKSGRTLYVQVLANDD